MQHSAHNQSEEVLYFISVKNYLNDMSEHIRLADRNGVNWVQETLERIALFREVCRQTEVVWSGSDYIWSRIRRLHEQSLKLATALERHIELFDGADFNKIDHYLSNYALPFSFLLDEYEQALECLAEEGLSAQAQ